MRLNLEKIRDWWRGYTYADVLAVHDKFKPFKYKTGEIVPVTQRELRALCDPARILFSDAEKMLSNNGKQSISAVELESKTPWMAP